MLQKLHDSYKKARRPSKVGMRFPRLKAVLNLTPEEVTQALKVLEDEKLIRKKGELYEITNAGIKEIEAGESHNRIAV